MIPAMGGTPASVRVLVAIRPVDFRKGMGGLAALVKDELLQDPYLCLGRDYVAEAA